MRSRQYLRDLITERLTAAAEEIFTAFEQTIVEYEEEVDRQRKLLEIVYKPRIQLQQIELPQQLVCKEEEVLTEQQLWNQKRNSSLDRGEPESLQIKEEQEEICTSHEGEQLEVKQEADIIMLTLVNEQSDHMEPEPDSDQQLLSQSSAVAESQDQTGSNHVEKNITEHKKDVDLQHRLLQMSQSTELPQQLVCEEEEVLTEQQLWNQERNSSLDQEKPESLQMKEDQEEICTSHEGQQLEVKQEVDFIMVTLDNEESDHMENQSQNQTGSNHVDSVSNRNAELKPHKRNEVENCHTSNTESETHTGKKSFRCDTCGKKFAHKSRLIVHVRVHTGEKPFSCTTCSKCFRTKWDMLDHMRIHTGEKPFSCQTCGKCFIRSSVMKIHMRTHTGEKPYSCETCGKCYAQRTNLLYHERTHTGEKPYFCKICGKCFRDGSGLKSHMRTHTG